MKFSISGEARQRHACIDKTVADVMQTLTEPAVIAHVGEENAAAMQQLLDRSYVPNLKDGLITAPRRYRNEYAIPIVAIRQGEAVRTEPVMNVLSLVQAGVVARKYRAWSEGQSNADADRFIAEINRGLQFRPSGVAAHESRVTAGVVSTPVWAGRILMARPDRLGKRQDRVIVGRPLVGLMMNGERSQESLNSILVHELVHVSQVEANPVASIEPGLSRYKKELEAYHFQAHYGRGLIEIPGNRYEGCLQTSNAEFLDSLRSAYVRPSEPFYANQELRDMIDEAGIDYIFGQPRES